MSETYVHVLILLILLGEVSEMIYEPFPGLLKDALESFHRAMI
jgi:hypothetical protein